MIERKHQATGSRREIIDAASSHLLADEHMLDDVACVYGLARESARHVRCLIALRVKPDVSELVADDGILPSFPIRGEGQC